MKRWWLRTKFRLEWRAVVGKTQDGRPFRVTFRWGRLYGVEMWKKTRHPELAYDFYDYSYWTKKGEA